MEARTTYEEEMASILRRTRGNASAGVESRLEGLEAKVEMLINLNEEKDKKIASLESRLASLEFARAKNTSEPVHDLTTSSVEQGRTLKPIFETPIREMRAPSTSRPVMTFEQTISEVKLTRKSSIVSLILLSLLNSVRDWASGNNPSLENLPPLDSMPRMERLVRGALSGIIGFDNLPSIKSKEFIETSQVLHSKINASGRIDISPIGLSTFKINSSSSRYFRWVTETMHAFKKVPEILPFPYGIIVQCLSPSIIRGNDSNCKWDLDLQEMIRKVQDEDYEKEIEVDSLLQSEYVYLRLEGFTIQEASFVIGLRGDGKKSTIKPSLIKKSEHRVANTRIDHCEVTHREERKQILEILNARGSLPLSCRVNEDMTIEVNKGIVLPYRTAQNNAHVLTSQDSTSQAIRQGSEDQEKPRRTVRKVPPSLLRQ